MASAARAVILAIFALASLLMVVERPSGPVFPGYATVPSPRRLVPFSFDELGTQGLPDVEAFLARVRSLPLEDRLRAVDEFVNRQPAVPDWERYAGDRWLTPREFFRRGGDCEDFAIAKYSLLRSLGVPPRELYVVVLRETISRLQHAVVVVFVAGRPLVLDNLATGVVPLDLLADHRPAISVNELGEWLHEPLPRLGPMTRDEQEPAPGSPRPQEHGPALVSMAAQGC